MSKRTAEKPHTQTPPERTPPRSPPEPPQRHIPKPTQPEPHQSGGQTHRQPHFLPFSTMQDFLQYEDLSCRKTFIKFFFRSCDKAPAFLLYICTEYKPGTPGATPGNSQGRTGQDHRHQRREQQDRPHMPPNVQISPPWTASRRTKAELAVTHAGRAYATMAYSVGEDVL